MYVRFIGYNGFAAWRWGRCVVFGGVFYVYLGSTAKVLSAVDIVGEDSEVSLSHSFSRLGSDVLSVRQRVHLA